MKSSMKRLNLVMLRSLLDSVVSRVKERMEDEVVDEVEEEEEEEEDEEAAVEEEVVDEVEEDEDDKPSFVDCGQRADQTRISLISTKIFDFRALDLCEFCAKSHAHDDSIFDNSVSIVYAGRWYRLG